MTRAMDARASTRSGGAAAIVAVLAGLVAGGHVSSAYGRSIEDSAALREQVAAHPLRSLEGDATLRVAELAGEVVVVNFWATWCKPCQDELPVLDALHETIVPHGGRVLAVSIDRDRARAERYVREQGLELPVFHDGPEGLVRTLDLEHFPFTVVFDRQGAVAYTAHDTSEEALAALEARVEALVREPHARVAEGGAR